MAKLDVESEAAGWGTACHQLSEKCFARNIDADALIGTTETTKSHKFEVDDEMADCAQEYVDYVHCRMADYEEKTGKEATLHVEQRFSLAKLDPPFDAGGTGDAVIFFPAWKLIEVVDLKGGRGIVVEVNNNKQLRTYGLGAMLANPGLDITHVMSTVVQPRAPHKDGRIRSETYHVTELMEWTGELVEKMHKAADAMAKFDQVKSEVTRDFWSFEFLNAGDHCTFCPAAGICPTLEKKASDAADIFFDDRDQPVIRNTPELMDPDRIAKVLDMSDMIGNWLNAVRATATRLVESGTKVGDYYLAERTGRRKFKDADAAPFALINLGLDRLDVYEEKLRSPAQIEKALGKKRLKPIEAQFKALIHTPITGTTLVSGSKSTKPPAKSKAEIFFT